MAPTVVPPSEGRGSWRRRWWREANPAGVNFWPLGEVTTTSTGKEFLVENSSAPRPPLVDSAEAGRKEALSFFLNSAEFAGEGPGNAADHQPGNRVTINCQPDPYGPCGWRRLGQRRPDHRPDPAAVAHSSGGPSIDPGAGWSV